MIDRLTSYPGVPPELFTALREYFLHGTPPGGFLTAVLSNDLHGAHATASDPFGIPALVRLLHNELPARSYGVCWGNLDRVKKWVQKGGLHGGGLEG